MAKFSYVVKDREGKTIRNMVEASTRVALINKLQREKYFIVSIKEIAFSSSKKRSKSSVKKKKGKKFHHKKVKLVDMLAFSKQLATMLESGVSLIRSISVIQEQSQSEVLFHVLLTIKKDIEQGISLSLALSKHPNVFNQFWISLVEVGEASGTIPTVLNKLAFYLEQEDSFRKKIVSGVIYPAILMGICVGAILIFAIFIGPKFEEVFTSMDAELPMMTAVLLSVFRVIKNNFFLLVGGITGVVFLFKKYIRTYNGRLQWEKFVFGLPTFGEISNLIVVERFCSQMAILIDSGVPILYALDISERLVDNNTCALIINDIKEGVKKGELLVAPMDRSGFFPAMCIQMITVGEETGELSKMLKHVSKYYQSNVETFMDRFATIVEPFMLVFMGGTIGVIVIAMFLPMFSLSSLGG